MNRNPRHLADAEHAAQIRAEMEAAKTPSDQLSQMRGYLVEFDRSSARFPELDCARTHRLRAELVAEIERLERIAAN
jgi:hypothetical protein